MRYPCYFADGPVTVRLLSVLREKTAKEILDLVQRNCFRLFREETKTLEKKKQLYLLTAFNLLPEHIAAYVEDTDYTLHDVFYGLNAEVAPGCTDYDKEILGVLEQLSDDVLERLFDCIQRIYPNTFFSVGRNLSPNHKLKLVFSRLPRGALASGNKSFNHPGVVNLSEETKADLSNYILHHCNNSYLFDVNCMTEYASFVKVSLHWLWNLSTPLYCSSQIADRVYDYFTLMQPEDQKELLSMLLAYLVGKE